MMLREDKECSVCFLPYSRYERVPRVLHCEHTFCTPCLKLMAQLKDRLFTVRCPLCRQTTWIKPERGLLGTLWVDINKWDQISEEEEEEEEEEEDEEAEPENQAQQSKETQLVLKQQQPSSKQSRLKMRLPVFLRRLQLVKQQQETVLPVQPNSNVEMKSWRRLTAEEMI